MNLIIHRGTHEIGGTCVEITTDETRIIIDLGMPLADPRDKKKKLKENGPWPLAESCHDSFWL